MTQAAKRPNVNPAQVRKSLITWVVIVAAVIAVTQIGWSNIWREVFIRPFLNALLFLYAHLGESFVVAIAVFTLLLRLITMPLQVKQILMARHMSELQPKLQDIQKKYGGDKQRLALEQQKLYKEAGVNPLGGCLPTLVQLPIWFALYSSIGTLLADTPVELMALGQRAYASFARLTTIVPLQSRFLWLNLARPDQSSFPYLLPILVGGTMWLQQKLMTQPSSDSQQAQMNQTMQIMMPVMFGFFTLQFSSGLAIYFIISNTIGILMQLLINRLWGTPKTEAAEA
ncbi:MAG: membrane protein insertase YidC [Anaerolineae bacterium]|nr:membrane protein insertase YidC [Anaerolineae bacterium]